MFTTLAFIFSKIFFFLIITPLGFLLRILNLNKIKKKYDKKANSYWIKKNKKINNLYHMLRQR
ncbi:MAG: hypothetical protein CMP24_04050 [Rickettsiales bacterium]|nr:hypothetical protein [Rickettsiales bacterium]